MRHDPFRDEVAIDFPSVGHFVERARERFVADRGGEGGQTLNTEVHVSRDQVFRGTVLPVDLPLRCTCVMCGGRGESWAEFCLACAGTGDSLVSYRVNVPVPPGVAHGARFRFSVRPPQASPVRVEVTVLRTEGDAVKW